MKPFYGIDRTENKKNTFHEGDCFIAASTSRAVSSAMEGIFLVLGPVDAVNGFHWLPP